MKIFFKTNLFRKFLSVVFLTTLCSNSRAENLTSTGTAAIADTFDIKTSSFNLPQALPEGKYSSALYLLNIVLSPDWTHDVIKAPMIYYTGKYTLPHGFNLQAGFATLIVSNRFNLGPFWNYSRNNFHCGVGYQVVFNYGILNEFGYHSTLTGWEQQPSVALGYSFKTMAVTLRGDLYVTNSLYVNEGGNVISYTNDFVNGYSITTTLEQRLVKNRVFSFGFKWSHLRYHILGWPAFPVNSYYYGVPEFQMGLNF